MRGLNGGSWVFCDFQLVGQLQALVYMCMIEMAVGWISYGGLSAFFTGHIHPFHIPKTRVTLLASDNEEKNQHPPAVELDT